MNRIVDSSSEKADLFIHGTRSSKLRPSEKEGVSRNGCWRMGSELENFVEILPNLGYHLRAVSLKSMEF